MRNLKTIMFQTAFCFLFGQLCAAQLDSLSKLSEDFWNWRAEEQPFSEDDIPRIERPLGLLIDWSPQTLHGRRQQLATFEQRLKHVSPSAQAMASEQVD